MRILLVEDDRKGALILSRGLTEEGFTVDLAADGSEAEVALGTVDYDLVILDWLLPGKPGIEVVPNPVGGSVFSARLPLASSGEDHGF
jgi:DNA-binding response OmpR family regulator